MLRQVIVGLIFGLICLSTDANAQKPVPKAAVPSKVTGLELPEIVFVDPNAEFTSITAKTAGSVKWMVISDKNVKYLQDDDKKAIILGAVPDNATILVIAVANVDGKTTDFVSTKVVLRKKNDPVKEIQNEKLDYRIRWH